MDLGKALRLAAEDAPGLFDDLAGQMEGVAAAFTAFILEARFVLAASDPSRVYWAEKCPANRRTRQPAHVRMVAAPLSVAGEMKRYFYDAKDSVVLCSATLRAGDKFDYMARKLGTSLVDEDRLARLVAASPFDYFRQTLMLAPNCLPDPAESMTRYVDALAPFRLVLFTAYEMMRAAAERTRPLLEAAGIDLLVQGDGVSRESMVAALKDALRPAVRPLVLFGAQSFWEGVDVPGPALSCVVLARLPFPQVGEPIVEARCERIKEQGGTPFRDYMLPEAQVRFRQGFGRLVRTQGDRGVVVVTDPRLAAKNYGALFRKAVPASVHTMATLEETLARAAEFLAR